MDIMESSTTTQSSFIHRYNILLKLHYFLFFSSFGALYPILSITLRARGLSDNEISFINIIIPFIVFLTSPLFGFIADRSRRYKLTFCLVVTTCTISFGIMFFLPTMKTEHIKGTLTYDNNSKAVLNFCANQEIARKCSSRSKCGCSYKANCSTTDQLNPYQNFQFPFGMDLKNIHLEHDENVASPECEILYHIPVVIKTQKYSLSRFRKIDCQITCSISGYCQGKRYDDQIRYLIFYALLFILGNNFLSNAVPLGASIGIAALTHRKYFGQQRVFGTVAFGIIAFLASRIYKIFETDLVYIIIFVISTISCMIITCFIRIQRKSNANEIASLSDENKLKSSQSRLTTLLSLCRNIDVLVFLALTTVWGISYAGLDPYLFLYLDEFAPCLSHSIVGYMALTSAIAEVLGFFSAARLIKTLGTNLTSIVILLAFAVRFGGYYFINYPYLFIITETMHFFNFGVLFSLIVQEADAIAPQGLSGTLQGIALGMSFGLGRGIGLLIASFIYALIAHRFLFLIFSMFNLCAAGIFSLYFLFTYKRRCSMRNNDQIVSENDANNKTEPLLDTVTNNPSITE